MSLGFQSYGRAVDRVVIFLGEMQAGREGWQDGCHRLVQGCDAFALTNAARSQSCNLTGALRRIKYAFREILVVRSIRFIVYSFGGIEDVKLGG